MPNETTQALLCESLESTEPCHSSRWTMPIMDFLNIWILEMMEIALALWSEPMLYRHQIVVGERFWRCFKLYLRLNEIEILSLSFFLRPFPRLGESQEKGECCKSVNICSYFAPLNFSPHHVAVETFLPPSWKDNGSGGSMIANSRSLGSGTSKEKVLRRKSKSHQTTGQSIYNCKTSNIHRAYFRVPVLEPLTFVTIIR